MKLLIFILFFTINLLFAQNYKFSIENDSLCDYLIVAPKVFENEAKLFCIYRDTNKNDFVNNPRYILTDSIFQYYSSYNISKSKAIKEYLNLLITKLNNLRFIFFIGSGYLETDEQKRENYIPAITFDNGDVQKESFISDDFYLFFDLSNTELKKLNKVSIGRLEARSKDDIFTYFKKIQKYEAGFSAYKTNMWRNKLIIAIDDDSNGYENYTVDPFFHEKNYKLYLHDHIPEYFYNKVIFMRDYPVEPSIKYSDKPDYPAHRYEARDDFLSEINSGSLITIYIGHSYYTVNSMEGLFEIYYYNSEKLKPKGDKYSFYMILGCMGGAFQYDEQAIASMAVVKDGFAIASLASSYELTEYQNLIIGNSVLDTLFANKRVPLGEYVMKAKLAAYNILKNSIVFSYIYFGDPSLVFNIPQKAMANKEVDTFWVGDYKQNVEFSSPELLITKQDTLKKYFNTLNPKDSIEILVNGDFVGYFSNDSINLLNKINQGNLYISYINMDTQFIVSYKDIFFKYLVACNKSCDDKYNDLWTYKVNYVYPNPAKSYVKLPNGAIEIYDKKGRLIIKDIVKKNYINVKKLVPGYYIIRWPTKKVYSTFYKINEQ